MSSLQLHIQKRSCSSVNWNQEGWQTLIQSETCWDAQDHGVLIKTSYLDLYVINWNHSRPQDRKKLNTRFKSHHKRFQVFKQTNFLNQNFPCTYYMAPFNKLPQILTNLNTAQLAWLNNMTAVRLLFLLFMFLIIQYIIQCDSWTQYQKTKSNVVKQDVWCGRQAWCHVFKFFIHELTKLKPCK